MLADEQVDEICLRLDSVVTSSTASKALQNENVSLLQVTLPESIFLYDLSHKVPRVVSFVTHTAFYMHPANFVDMGV